MWEQAESLAILSRLEYRAVKNINLGSFLRDGWERKLLLTYLVVDRSEVKCEHISSGIKLASTSL